MNTLCKTGTWTPASTSNVYFDSQPWIKNNGTLNEDQSSLVCVFIMCGNLLNCVYLGLVPVNLGHYCGGSHVDGCTTNQRSIISLFCWFYLSNLTCNISYDWPRLACQVIADWMTGSALLPSFDKVISGYRDWCDQQRPLVSEDGSQRLRTGWFLLLMWI